jgi:riboflavin biosynthesis pyrimidine reductase
MVGRGTAQSDRMTMGLPDEELRRQRLAEGKSEYPLRVLVSGSGQVPTDLPLFGHSFSPILIYSTQRMPTANRLALKDKTQLWLASHQQLDIREILADLWTNHGVRSIVCEGGPTLARTLAAANVVDEIHLTIAARLFGGQDAPGLLGRTHQFLPASRHFILSGCQRNRADGECYLHYLRSDLHETN